MLIHLDLFRLPDLLRRYVPPELRFDGLSEAVAPVGMLALQMPKAGIGIVRVDGRHDHIQVLALSCCRIGAQCEVGRMRVHQRIGVAIGQHMVAVTCPRFGRS